MNRRYFIKSLSLSFGSVLLYSTNAFAHTPKLHQSVDLQLPDRMRVVLESDEELSLEGNKEIYDFGDVQVKVERSDGGRIFRLSSSSKAIKYVIAEWNMKYPVTSVMLGDHWERGYGDLQWKKVDKERIMPWYFMEYDGKTCNGFGVKTNPSAFCYWMTEPLSLRLVMDLRNGSQGVRLGSRELVMAETVCYQGSVGERPFLSLRNFCKKMCPLPRLPKQPVYGINDWYFAYGQNSDELILQTVDLTTDLARNTQNRPYCVIDAGWAEIAPFKKDASSWSDNFYTPNSRFKDMGKLAGEIKARGMRPGLWMRPLCASKDTPTNQLLHHSNRISRDEETLRDPTVPETSAYLQKCFQAYHNWHFEIVKHDYTSFDIMGRWGAGMLGARDMTKGKWHFHNRSLTNAEVVRNLYQTIRKAAGDILLIGCNTFSHLSAGLFEVNRIGDDTSGKEWARTVKMGVNSLAFRAAHHNLFYAADPDCVGLTTEVDWKMNKQWLQLIAGSGTPLFVSAQPQAVGAEQRQAIRSAFDIASKEIPVGEPLDWLTTLTPSKWQLNGARVQFDW